MNSAMHSVLRDGQELAYDVKHAEVPDDIVAALHRAGIRDWTIWRSGHHLFHVVDSVDLAAAMASLANDPANIRWQEEMGGFVDHFEPASESTEVVALAQVWSLSQQISQRGMQP